MCEVKVEQGEGKGPKDGVMKEQGAKYVNCLWGELLSDNHPPCIEGQLHG